MNKRMFFNFVIAFILALAASRFTVFSGMKYAMYSLGQALLMLPVGLAVMILVQRLVAKIPVKG